MTRKMFATGTESWVRGAIRRGDIDAILSLFDGDEIDQRNGYWFIPCPAHDDQSPSCKVMVGETGRLVFKDFGGPACEFEAIVSGLEARANGTDAPQDQDDPDLLSEWDETPEFKRRWAYAGSDGKTYTKHRIGRGAAKKEWWSPKRPEGVTLALRETTPLDEVPLDHVIDLVDGDVDADAIHEAGGAAVTCGSLSQLTEEHAERLKGRTVRVWGDRDGGKGAKQARRAIRLLRSHARSVKCVEAAAGKDAADHLAAGHKLDQALPAWYIVMPRDTWEPTPPNMRGEAFHGLAGDFVSLLDPYTEADPHAVLVQMLVAFGNSVGRRPHLTIGATRHCTNEYVLVVGDTSAARKGTGAREVMHLLTEVADSWAAECVVHGGLVSGEALVMRAADKTELVEGEAEGEGHARVTIRDEHDGRLLVIEEEFSALLAVLGRPNQTLSSMLRKGWDGRPIENLSLSNPFTASDHHISVIAHVTLYELQERLQSLDMANGFANRFLFCHSTRSKILPEPGRPAEAEYAALVRRFTQTHAFAKKLQRPFAKSKDAQALWNEELYEALTISNYGGMMDAVTARRSDHVQRLAMVYAVLDKSQTIEVEHLRAAHAVWDYSEETCRFVFADATGSRDADTILDALRARAEGMTRLEVTNLFQRNRSKKQIDSALHLLLRLRLAEEVTEPTTQRGRPTTRFYAL